MRLSTCTPSRRRPLIVCCAAAVCALLAVSSEALGQAGPPGPASAEALVNGIQTIRRGDTVTKVDRTGKGAVLCMRGILQAIRAVGQACHEDADPEFQRELKTSLDPIDQFIAENARNGTVPSRSGPAECQPRSVCGRDAEMMYGAFRTGAAAGLRAGRRPALDPARAGLESVPVSRPSPPGLRGSGRCNVGSLHLLTAISAC
ncbi:hypothetical protein MKK84_01190 [Methylobacterium sp. E-065]|uniref:hypothetical protein n=1 Tax=Methylobacterium sp. E-065 TaxID=2836583 RepID=UPI001FBAD68E|nr:hypothetical protein [Methylobacterium sp. E-065]MCJ2016053.1 hypothetical protein [Methylobacterium sp. E-065]